MTTILKKNIPNTTKSVEYNVFIHVYIPYIHGDGKDAEKREPLGLLVCLKEYKNK